jgi:hypothetical protein
VTRLVGAGLDVALAQLARLLAPLLAEGAPGLEREAVLAALNGGTAWSRWTARSAGTRSPS